MNKKCYKNLRKNYNLIISDILGGTYYNAMMDQESSDDACCDEILKTVDEMRNQIVVWKMIAGFGCTIAIMFVFAFFKLLLM